MNGSVKEPIILIYFFFSAHQSMVFCFWYMFCLLVEGECQILVFENIIN